MNTKVKQYSNLELVFQPKTDNVKDSTTRKWIEKLSKFLINCLANNNEPNIRKTVDRLGNVYWQVYDPITRQRMSFTSEQNVREWLEQRYYCSFH